MSHEHIMKGFERCPDDIGNVPPVIPSLHIPQLMLWSQSGTLRVF